MADSKSDHVFAQLKQDILDGTLRPGQSLRAAEVGERFVASRTPVRQAFLRLAAEGLVSLHERQGARVVPITVQGVRDLFELRLLLEAAAARSVAEACVRDDLARDRFGELVAAFETIDGEETAAGDGRDGLGGTGTESSTDRRRRFYALAEDFDQAVITHTRNRHLARSVADLRPHSDRLRNISHSRPEGLRASLADHIAMARAILSGDTAAATQTCVAHLTRVRDSILHAVLDPDSTAPPVTFS